MGENESNCETGIFRSFQEFFKKRSSKAWIEKRRNADDLDGLWRIHDNLYDVSSFINNHPGGRFWLEETKGLDITEAFEVHHVKSDLPELILKQFFVKKATKPRDTTFTLHENGFYRTFKKRARPVIETLPKNCLRISNLYIDSLFLSTIILACLANAWSSFALLFLASIASGFLITAGHNYSHQRDNFRMFYGGICMLHPDKFRTLHVLSHHLFPNSRKDIQLEFLLPLVNLFPEKKSFAVKYLSFLFAITFAFPLALYGVGILSLIESLVQRQKIMDQLPHFVLPVLMYYSGTNTILYTIGMWHVFIFASSTVMSLFSFTTTHAHPDLYTEGDVLRPQHQLDWGIAQIDSTYDRSDIMGNHFLTLVTFGDHALHHFFPTLDHGQLKYLYPVLRDTLQEFKLKDINITTSADLYLGFLKQAARELPRIVPVTY